MMKKSEKLAILTCSALFCFSLQNSESATLISGSGITATASTVNGSFGLPNVVVNGTGLSSGLHSNANNSQWYTGNGNGGEGAANAWISFDLGSSVVLDSIHVWNSTASGLTNLGIKDLDIYVSTVATPGDPEVAGAANADNWTKIATNVTFLQSPTSNVTGFDLETQVGNILLGTAVRHVRFEANSNFAGTTNYVGLAEVQFFEADAIPEPSAALLGGLGVLALLRRRR